MGDRRTRPGHRAGARRAESAHLPSARPAGSVRSPGRHAEAAPGPGPARQGQRTVLKGHVQGTAPRSRAHSATWTGGAPIETCGPARKAGTSGLGESQGKGPQEPGVRRCAPRWPSPPPLSALRAGGCRLPGSPGLRAHLRAPTPITWPGAPAVRAGGSRSLPTHFLAQTTLALHRWRIH